MKPWYQRHPLWVLAVMPIVPQLVGSIFNVWYNTSIIIPALPTEALHVRFAQTVLFFNLIVYPVGAGIWLYLVTSLHPVLSALEAGKPPSADQLNRARALAINLPWIGSSLAGAAWLLCIPVFLISLVVVEGSLPTSIWMHLPISFFVSAIIAITHSFFLVELTSQRLLFPMLFAGARADQTPGARVLSVRGRGWLWAISAGLCPIGSLLLLVFAPAVSGRDTTWLALFVGTVGIAFGLCSALMINRLVAEPIDHLTRAAKAIAAGNLSVRLEAHRADEFGLLLNEFNLMTEGLRQKARIRETLGLHVGETAARYILRRDPGVTGVEETITVMFVDIRDFTARTQDLLPAESVRILNLFLERMVEVVESRHHGMINKFLGDGFMALFGIDEGPACHAENAVATALDMVKELNGVNQELVQQGQAPLTIGIGLHCGPAIVGSIGSPHRLEFTAIGATVNLASRIESLTKKVGHPILFTDAIRRELPADFPCHELPAQQIKGVGKPVRVFTPSHGDPTRLLS
ncbi:MAG: adenylate/guanylate cyclase domain-containing protein [Candidatus Methylacidiphilales bacterium]